MSTPSHYMGYTHSEPSIAHSIIISFIATHFFSLELCICTNSAWRGPRSCSCLCQHRVEPQHRVRQISLSKQRVVQRTGAAGQATGIYKNFPPPGEDRHTHYATQQPHWPQMVKREALLWQQPARSAQAGERNSPPPPQISNWSIRTPP